MTNKDDEKALKLLHKAVEIAQNSLIKSQHFRPFLLLLKDTQEELFFENSEEDVNKSYELLESLAKEKIDKERIEVMILAIDTLIPENFSKDKPMGIRLHLEEKSQLDNKLGARFIYVPYELCQTEENKIFVKLLNPIPVGLPAEYIKR